MKLLRKLFHKPKPSWASLCNVAYTDRSGRKYYQYRDPLDMSILRKGEIEKCQLELRFGTDMEDICQAMQSAISASDKKGNMAPDISMIGFLVQELIDRKQYLVIPEILFKVLACTMLREDENPVLVDEEILAEKVETFKSELQHGGLWDFSARQYGGVLRFLHYYDARLQKAYDRISTEDSKGEAGSVFFRQFIAKWMNDRAKYLISEAGGPDKIEAIKGMSCKEYLAHIEAKIENELRKRAAQNNL